MNAYGLAALFFSFNSVMVAIFVIIKRNDKVGRTFLAFNLLAAGWAQGLPWLISYNVSYEVALFSSRALNLFAIFIPPTWYHFVCAYLAIQPKRKQVLTGLYVYSILLSTVSFHPAFVNHLTSMVGFRYFTQPGPLYHLFTVLFSLAVTAAFVELFVALRFLKGEERKRLKILISAMFVAFVGGSPTFLPVYGIPWPQYNLFLMPIYPLLMAYAIMKRGLLESENILAIHREKLALIGLMTSSVNHELRNPLFLIRESAKKIASQLEEKKNSESMAALSSISKNLDRISDLVGRLRDFGKVNQDKNVADEVDLKKAIHDALFFVSQELKYHNVEIKEEIPDDLPKIKGDKNQLEEIFLNLFMNALQAMPKGGLLSIVLRTSNIVHREKGNRSTKYEVQCTITDTGTGIPKDELKHIFTPFYTKKEKEGTGLGLYIVKSLVEQNSGKITVESEVGKGTTFWLEFSP